MPIQDQRNRSADWLMLDAMRQLAQVSSALNPNRVIREDAGVLDRVSRRVSQKDYEALERALVALAPVVGNLGIFFF